MFKKLKILTLLQLSDRVKIKKDLTIAQRIAQVAKTLLAMAVCFGIFAVLFYVIFKLIGFRASENLLILVILLTQVLSIVSCTVSLSDTLYISKDNQMLMTYPVKYVFVYGNAKNEISAALNKYNINFIECENINNAIFNSVISSQALNGVNNTTSHSKNTNKNKVAILFSPACASFDNFNSFEERGLYFKEYLKSSVEDVFDIPNK